MAHAAAGTPATGISVGNILHPEDLADDWAQARVCDFFTAQPLHLPGAAGSPINPQAIK